MMEQEIAIIKSVPADPLTRELIRSAAKNELSSRIDSSPLSYDELTDTSQKILENLKLSEEFTGFTMVALHNAFWRDAFARVPYNRRILLLPHCLRNIKECNGTYDSEGLTCGGCGSCNISALSSQAMALGYQVVIAEYLTVKPLRYSVSLAWIHWKNPTSTYAKPAYPILQCRC
jgi:hypothetical protein